MVGILQGTDNVINAFWHLLVRIAIAIEDFVGWPMSMVE